jgi:serine/threonine protein kinase
LDHKNVLKFYGTVKLADPLAAGVYRFAFVMKYCKANLKDIVFKGRTLAPAQADNSNEAIVTFLQLVVDIAEGLNYIHERGLVHRHLKLENVLVGINILLVLVPRRM